MRFELDLVHGEPMIRDSELRLSKLEPFIVWLREESERLKRGSLGNKV